MNRIVPLCQSDTEWHSDILGHGGPGDTLGRYGCAVSSLAMIANALGVTKHATPRTVNNFLTKIPGVFVDKHSNPGTRIVWQLAAAKLGLRALESDRVRGEIGDPALPAAARKAFEAGGLCIFHVDHNKDIPGGDPNGDHYIASDGVVESAVTLSGAPVPAHFVCADPAPGKFCNLDARTLYGVSDWHGKTKRFNVVSVIPVFRA